MASGSQDTDGIKELAEISLAPAEEAEEEPLVEARSGARYVRGRWTAIASQRSACSSARTAGFHRPLTAPLRVAWQVRPPKRKAMGQSAGAKKRRLAGGDVRKKG